MTIIWLLNQKYCKLILYKRKKFKTSDGLRIDVPTAKIFENKNLTNSNQQLAFTCRKLKRAKFIPKICCSKGIIHIVQIHSNKPIKVFHQSNRDDLFPDLNLNGGGEASDVAPESL